MARKAGTIEYLERLVEWAGGRAVFLKLTKIHSPNLTAYLNGDKSIAWKRLKTATSEVLGCPPAFVTVLEGHDLKADGKPKLADLTNDPGIYAFFDSTRRVIYYGKATSLYAEVRQTLARKVAGVRPWTGPKNLTFNDITAYISAYKIARGDATFRHDLEAFGLRILVNNTFNKNSGSFKRTE